MLTSISIECFIDFLFLVLFLFQSIFYLQILITGFLQTQRNLGNLLNGPFFQNRSIALPHSLCVCVCGGGGGPVIQYGKNTSWIQGVRAGSLSLLSFE